MQALDDVVAAVRAALEGPCGVVAGEGLVAACSGGADSVALVVALGQLGARWPLRAVVYVDHGLRPGDAERAAAREAARLVGAPFVTERVALEGGGNLQARARRARYDVLLRVAGPDGLVATGHTATDQAETVLQRLLRGAGLRGLAGVRSRAGRVVRPLLAVDRVTTRALGLSFADDPSNATDRFQRNRLRAILSALEEEAPGAGRALACVAEQVAVELELLDALADAVDLATSDLRGVPPDVAAALVRWRLRREHPQASPSRPAVAELVAQLVRGATARVSLGSGLEAVGSRGRLGFSAERDPRFEVVAHGPGTYRLRTAQLVLVEAASRAMRGADAATTAWLPPGVARWPLVITEVRESAWLSDGAAREGSAPGGQVGGGIEAAQERSALARFVITDALGREVWPARAPAPVGGGEEMGAAPGLLITLRDGEHLTEIVAPKAISVACRESSDH